MQSTRTDLAPTAARRSPAARRAVLAAVLLAPLAGVAACSGSSSSSSGSSSSGAGGYTSSTGVQVKGAFGSKPTVTVPTSNPPAALKTEVVSAGTGDAVATGQTAVVNYLGQTWKPKDNKPNVFDNSFDKKQVFAFTVGAGGVIKGWDQGLVGAKVGSRVLLTIPPNLAYGATASAQNELAGQELVFVVDLVDKVPSSATATGTPVTTAPPAGFPRVDSQSGKPPAITSVAGLKKVTAPESALLIKGDGAPLDPTKSLLLQLTSTDAATGKKTQSTYGTAGPQVYPAADIVGSVSAFKGATVGSRAVILTPASQAQAAAVFVMDILRQY